jgi:glycosyltransferase involved in cell wall biosynthesis
VSALPVAEPPVPRVSVVVPTYNRAPMLGRLLGALARCEVPQGGIEVIVVDDGSSDDTRTVVERSGVPALRYVRQENAGAAAARNRGWRHARGELVVFTDDDCVPSPTWLVELDDAMTRTACDGAGGAIVPLVPGYLADFVQAERLVGHGGDADDVKYLVTANAVFRRATLEAVGGFDERFPGAAGEDTDLTMRLRASNFAVTLVDGAVVAHDHRTTVPALLRTYRRHGAARHMLTRLHPGAGVGMRARRMTTVGYWRRRYTYYRVEGASRSVAALYCGLRLLGLGSYAYGLARATLRERG